MIDFFNICKRKLSQLLLFENIDSKKKTAMTPMLPNKNPLTIISEITKNAKVKQSLERHRVYLFLVQENQLAPPSYDLK